MKFRNILVGLGLVLSGKKEVTVLEEAGRDDMVLFYARVHDLCDKAIMGGADSTKINEIRATALYQLRKASYEEAQVIVNYVYNLIK